MQFTKHQKLQKARLDIFKCKKPQHKIDSDHILNSDYIEFMNKYSATIDGCTETMNGNARLEYKFFNSVFQELGDVEKSHYIAQICVDLILSSKNMNQKNQNKRKSKKVKK